jgi:hypothetical protein
MPATLAWGALLKIPLNKGGGARFRATGDVRSAEETSPFKGGIDFLPLVVPAALAWATPQKIAASN